MDKALIQKAVNLFAGSRASPVPLGKGHIHQTYLVQAETPLVLQQINTHVFSNPEQVTENIATISSHLAANPGYPLRVLESVQSIHGHRLEELDGTYWRAFLFVPGTKSYDQCPSPEIAYKAAHTFGTFITYLSDLDPAVLHEVIPGFHDTPARFNALVRAASDDPLKRADALRSELELAETLAHPCSQVCSMLEQHPHLSRVVHNDTKLNNLLFDAGSDSPVCVIDLDTVMKGTPLYDFGDLVRTAAAQSAEDDPDLEKVGVIQEHFIALKQGWIEACQRWLTADEEKLLSLAAASITFETGIRFLTDYLLGDRYFHCARPGHNLDRARNQLKLAELLATM